MANENWNREIIITQLLALRAQCDASLAVLGVAMVEGQEAVACEHPLDKRKIVSAMGEPERWQCQVCGFIHTEEP